jgi:hypothetical protein
MSVKIEYKLESVGPGSPVDTYLVTLHRNDLAKLFSKQGRELHSGPRGTREIVEVVLAALGPLAPNLEHTGSNVSVRNDEPGTATLRVAVCYNGNLAHPDADGILGQLIIAGGLDQLAPCPPIKGLY